MEQAAAVRRYDQLHAAAPFHDGTFEKCEQWSAKATRRTPYHYLDGVTVWVSDEDLTPDDNFLGDPAVGEQPSADPTDHDQQEGGD